jgi:hypothetical protein
VRRLTVVLILVAAFLCLRPLVFFTDYREWESDIQAQKLADYEDDAEMRFGEKRARREYIRK